MDSCLPRVPCTHWCEFSGGNCLRRLSTDAGETEAWEVRVGLLPLCPRLLLLPLGVPCRRRPASHEIGPKTGQFGGRSPPHLVREVQHRAREVRITKGYIYPRQGVNPRDVLERGGGVEGGFGWDNPPPWVPLWSPPKAGRNFFSLNPLGTEGTEAKFWLSASNIWKGRRGVHGGYPPPPPAVYGRSNTSMGSTHHTELLRWGGTTRGAHLPHPRPHITAAAAHFGPPAGPIDEALR